MISHRLAVSCALLMLVAASAHAQIPDKFTNLKVLPKDTPKPELIKIMRGFSGDLGVRCSFCHEAKDPHDLSTFNFASDQVPEKATAREMMRMAKNINEQVDKIMGKEHPDHLKVTCFTCHHGNHQPETLADALVPVLKKDGPDAAVAHYKQLRTEYYGQATYDFSEWSLVQIAEELSHDPAQIAGARALLNANLEYYPESAATYARLGETYIAEGDTTTALTHMEKALTLAPEDQRLKQRIDAIKAGKK
ncbi:MAG TPA: c-type cytochrome [Candidatus Krumholzibacteria bacterium]